MGYTLPNNQSFRQISPRKLNGRQANKDERD